MTSLQTIGDLLAIPFWILIIYYFVLKLRDYKLKIIEKVILAFSLVSFVADLYFVITNLGYKKDTKLRFERV